MLWYELEMSMKNATNLNRGAVNAFSHVLEGLLLSDFMVLKPCFRHMNLLPKGKAYGGSRIVTGLDVLDEV